MAKCGFGSMGSLEIGSKRKYFRSLAKDITSCRTEISVKAVLKKTPGLVNTVLNKKATKTDDYSTSISGEPLQDPKQPCWHQDDSEFVVYHVLEIPPLQSTRAHPADHS